ncbi:hypothetical protein I308_103563 [Cryptococcus tetragattii IND107]|uniref:Uncharacterized protein n=1 Tax=Cryptococcus tetragattii IND107 TaxID=1296105 RepID=A0ABR3BQN0_9TREE
MTRVAIPEAGRIETPLRDEEGGFGGRRDDFEAVEEMETTEPSHPNRQLWRPPSFDPDTSKVSGQKNDQ